MAKSNSATKIVLIVSIAVIILAYMGYSILSRNMPAGNTIASNGVAEVKTLPDIVAVYLSIETNASTAAAAKDENAEISDDVLTSLVKLGLERAEITTQNYNIYEDIEWTQDGQKSKGWKAVNQLKVELKGDKTDMAGDVIDAGVDSGAKISYINFELTLAKQNEYKAQALTAATQDARTKAEAIASTEHFDGKTTE